MYRACLRCLYCPAVKSAGLVQSALRPAERHSQVRVPAVVPVLHQLQLWLLAIETQRARAAAEDIPVLCPQGYLAAAPPLVRWVQLPAAPLQQE